MNLALIPAGGKSVRMGRPKLSLPLGDRTILEQVILTLRRSGIERILVIVGAHVSELRLPAERAGAQVLQLTEDTPDMRATVQYGLDWVEQNWQPQDDDNWFLLPGDHPAVEIDTISRLLLARAENLDQTLFVPTFQARRGHPLLVAWRHSTGIRSLPSGAGINAYLGAHQAETLQVPVASASVLWDLDTPADYELLCRHWAGQAPR